VILYSFTWDTFIFDRVFIENVLNLLSFILETYHIHFFVFSLYLYTNNLYIFHICIHSIIKTSEFPLLNESLYSPLALNLMIDHKIYPTCLLDIIDMLDNRIDLVKFHIKIVLMIHKFDIE